MWEELLSALPPWVIGAGIVIAAEIGKKSKEKVADLVVKQGEKALAIFKGASPKDAALLEAEAVDYSEVIEKIGFLVEENKELNSQFDELVASVKAQPPLELEAILRGLKKELEDKESSIAPGDHFEGDRIDTVINYAKGSGGIRIKKQIINPKDR